MRAGLVVAQVALSMVLLLGAGLLMRTFVKLVGADLGLDPKNVLMAGIGFPPRDQMSPEAQVQFYRSAVERIGSIPGVSAAALTSATPPFGGFSSPLEVPGSAVPPQSTTLVTFASEQLLETVGMPVRQGPRAVSARRWSSSTASRWSTKRSRSSTSRGQRSGGRCGCRPSRRCRCRSRIPPSSSSASFATSAIKALASCRCRRSSCRSRSAPAGSRWCCARPASRRAWAAPSNASFSRSIHASPSRADPA